MLVAMAAAMAATVSGVPATPASSAAPVEKARPTRYCIVDRVTGSRVPKRVCATREEWLARGLDVDNPKGR